MAKTTKSKADYDRFSLTLPQQLNDWLYKFTNEIKRAGGYRVPKTLVVRAFVRAIKESKINIDISDIRDDTIKRGIAGNISSDKVENLLVKRIITAIEG
jgi:hypothetical protein